MTQPRQFRWTVVGVALVTSLTVTTLLVHLSDPLNSNVPGWTLTAGMVSGCAVMALWHPRPVLSTILFGALCYPILVWWTLVLILGFYEGP